MKKLNRYERQETYNAAKLFYPSTPSQIARLVSLLFSMDIPDTSSVEALS